MIQVPIEEIDEATAPNEFVCPISTMIMVDPVLASDGMTYERSQILNWLKHSKLSPKTREQLKPQLIQNKALKLAIKRHNRRLQEMNENNKKNKIEMLSANRGDIQSSFPQLTDGSGLLLPEKIYELAQVYQKMHHAAETMKNLWNSLKSKQNSKCKDCPIIGDIKASKRTIRKEIDPILSLSISSQQMIQKCKGQQIKYIILSKDDVKKIKSNKMKKSQVKIQILKRIKFDKITIKDIKKKIQQENSNIITNNHLMRIWKSDNELNKLFNNFSFDDKSTINESEYCKKQEFFIVEYYH